MQGFTGESGKALRLVKKHSYPPDKKHNSDEKASAIVVKSGDFGVKSGEYYANRHVRLATILPINNRRTRIAVITSLSDMANLRFLLERCC
jgi:hypothetical protein